MDDQLQRYGVIWSGRGWQPILAPMDDGYWTPHHIAQAKVERLAADNYTLAGRVLHAEAEVERVTAQRDWQQARNDALQKVQRHMRDPERKVVCDILANGTTYVEPFRAALAGEGDDR